MTRYTFLSLALVCAVGTWLSTSHADEEKAAPSGALTELMARIEKLEKRLAVLEDREQYPRQVNAVTDPSELKVPQQLQQGNTVTPKAGVEGQRPAARVWLLKQTEQKPATSAK
ncbi:MAG: hypothetical protein JWP89_302 [Schlesneria sp.]|nr:hypothetical protein [Schlesneria sp.]